MTKNNKILIIGATGFIGSHIENYFKKKNYKLTIHCRKVNKYITENYKTKNIIIGDITNKNIIKKIVSVDVDYIIYTISLNHKQSELATIRQLHKTNVQPLWEILENLKQTPHKKLIYLSTIHVYGNNLKQIVTEQTQTNPLNKYSLTHLQCENLISFYNNINPFQSLVLRLSNSYGMTVVDSKEAWNIIINELCLNAIKNNKIILQSNGKAEKDFLHIDEVVAVIEKIISTKNYNNEIFNLSYGKSIKLLSIAQIIQKEYYKMFKMKLPIFINNNEKLIKNVKETKTSLEIKNNLLKKQFDIKPIQNLSKGVKELFTHINSIND